MKIADMKKSAKGKSFEVPCLMLISKQLSLEQDTLCNHMVLIETLSVRTWLEGPITGNRYLIVETEFEIFFKCQPCSNTMSSKRKHQNP